MNQNKIYVKNGIIIFVTVVYNILLHFYNIKLHKLQNNCQNKIIAAIKVFEDKDFLIYLTGGAIIACLLIASTIRRIKDMEIIGLRNTVILVLTNIILLIILLVIYSNPILTTFVIVVGVGMFFMSM